MSNHNHWPYTNAVDPAIYATRTDWPKISIVTPSFNQGQFIEETILSILNQNYPNLEYIIIDGGSTDNTVEVIKKYEDRITYWVSETDEGQADAINKGLEKCTGEIFNWINSDDLLAPNSLFAIGKEFLNQPIDLLAGQCINFHVDIKTPSSRNFNSNLNLKDLLTYKDDFHQPGLWIRKALLLNSQLPSKYHYSFDRIWLLDILNKTNYKITIKNSKSLLAYFRIHNLSKTTSEWFKAEKELHTFLKDFIPHDKSLNILLKRLLSQLNFQIITREQIIDKKLDKIGLIKQSLRIILTNPKIILNKFFLGAIKLKLK